MFFSDQGFALSIIVSDPTNYPKHDLPLPLLQLLQSPHETFRVRLPLGYVFKSQTYNKIPQFFHRCQSKWLSSVAVGISSHPLDCRGQNPPAAAMTRKAAWSAAQPQDRWDEGRGEGLSQVGHVMRA